MRVRVTGSVTRPGGSAWSWRSRIRRESAGRAHPVRRPRSRRPPVHRTARRTHLHAVLRDATHWDDVVTKLGYEHLRRHDLRHTGLTWFADAGVRVPVLRRIAGHRSLTTTQRYLHPDVHEVTAAGAAFSATSACSAHGARCRARSS
ncbi:tyrosine-type recombinase/integrase [Streptomyces tendae]|uniref:tyrosine-type recombinase/integrase n=1 Tax=Streptomyces tendae TaxID=1932 RepID=UPI003CD0C7E8